MHLRSLLRPPLAALFLLCATNLSFAQGPYDSAKSGSVLDAMRAYESSRSAGSLNALQQVQQARTAALEQLMQSDPAAVLANALPSNLVARLPRGAQAAFEKHVVATGVLEVAVEDGPRSSRMHYNLVTGGRRLGLHFAGAAPGELLTGMFAQAKGVQVGGELALNSTDLKTNTTTSSTTSGATGTAILPNTFGVQRTLVILVNFQDNTSQPYTPATASSVTFSQASSFFLENSFQQTSLAGDVAGWFTIPVSSGSCNTSSIQTYAQKAAQSAGYVLSNYNRFIFAFPQTSACSWWGYSYIGGNPSYTWINGNYQLKVVAHELGHSFGLNHAHNEACGTAVYATSGCTVTEYGDYFDAMGYASPYNVYDYTASQKERLGWLNYGTQPSIQAVTASGSYDIGPYETADGLPKALKVPGPNGSFFYIESRQSIGDDTGWATVNPSIQSALIAGVLLHNYTPGNANTSYLLNFTPGGSWYLPEINPGQTFTDSTSGVSIAPVSVSSSGATVEVSLPGSSACVHALPTITSVGPGNSVAPGGTASFNVTGTNNDSIGCGASTFALGNQVPSGWTASYSATSITIQPSTSSSATLSVTASSAAGNGTYSIYSSASNTSVASYAANTSATETIYNSSSNAPASVSVSTSATAYSLGQSIGLTVTVLNGTSSSAGTSVTVQLTKANGSTVSLSGTTGTNGVAALSYKTKKNDPKGMWSATAYASSVSGTTSFTVQ